MRNNLKFESEDAAVTYLINNPWQINRISNPTEKMWISAVNNSAGVIKLQSPQTEAVCMASIKKYPRSIRHIEKPTHDMWVEAISRIGLVLEFIPEQTEELCILAVSQDYHALKLAKDQTPEIIRAAFICDCEAMKHVVNQTVDLCLEFLEKYVNPHQPKSYFKQIRIIEAKSHAEAIELLKRKKSILDIL